MMCVMGSDCMHGRGEAGEAEANEEKRGCTAGAGAARWKDCDESESRASMAAVFV